MKVKISEEKKEILDIINPDVLRKIKQFIIPLLFSVNVLTTAKILIDIAGQHSLEDNEPGLYEETSLSLINIIPRTEEGLVADKERGVLLKLREYIISERKSGKEAVETFNRISEIFDEIIEELKSSAIAYLQKKC